MNLNATLLELTVVSERLLILKVQPDCGVSNFIPGQYVALGVDPEVPRPPEFPPPLEPAPAVGLIRQAYSVVSAPSESEFLEFFVAVVPTGNLTPRFLSLKVGSRLYVARKVTGTFTLAQVPASASLIFVSTGTGIGPFISMLRSGQALENKRRVVLWHGARYLRDLAYHAELSSLAKINPNFTYRATLSREQEVPLGIDQGYVQQYLERDGGFSPSDHQVFLCGHPAMVDDCEQRLLKVGFSVHSRHSPGNLYVEKYW